jgi:hypothetical protein
MLNDLDLSVIRSMEAIPPILPTGRPRNRPDDAFDPAELEMGMKDEMEHTDDPETAKQIAKDHLGKDPHYYSKMKAKGMETESQAAGANSALLRAKNSKQSSRRVSEAARIISRTEKIIANPQDSTDAIPKGPMVKVVLISEGLGNRRDMNYYGPEALASAPAAFEGTHCFLNHPSYSEEQDIPERRVQDMCGFFKNVKVESIEGIRSVMGELHFDISESGMIGYQKLCTALRYQSEFPDSDKEYVGLSVNADGVSEEREMEIDGEPVVANYVTQFTDAMSCDIVTIPARGGKALALVESAAGANIRKKEVRKMIVKRLQAAQSALKEAAKIDDADKRKDKLSEAQKAIESLLKEVLEAARKEAKNAEKKEDESEAEAEGKEDEAEVAGKALHKAAVDAAKKKLKGMGEEPDADDKDEEEEDEATVVPGKTESKEKCEDEAESEKEAEDMATESARLAVKHLISESGLDAELFDVEVLAKAGLKEAKGEIARMKKVTESVTKKVCAALGDVSPAHLAKISESGKSGSTNNNELFVNCTL